MQLEVMLSEPYAKLLPAGSAGGKASLEVEGPATVGQVLDRLGVPERGGTYITVNGRRVESTCSLDDGDKIRVIVLLGGG